MIDLKMKKRDRLIVIISSKKTANRKPAVDFGNRALQGETKRITWHTIRDKYRN